MSASPPPHLSLDSTLRETLEWWLEVRCACGKSSFQPCRLLAQRYSQTMRLKDVLAWLRCQHCRSKPANVALIERADGHAHGREPLGWRLELLTAR